jgi:hypothetical protein
MHDSFLVLLGRLSRAAQQRLYRGLTRVFRRNGDHEGVNRKRFMLLAVVLVTLNTFFWVVPGGLALSQGLVDQLFGSRMIRAEVLVQTPTGTADYRIDRGVIRAVTPGAIVLKEKNGDMVPIQLASTASVSGAGGRKGSGAALRIGMRVVVFRLANEPADSIQVEGIGP